MATVVATAAAILFQSESSPCWLSVSIINSSLGISSINKASKVTHYVSVAPRLQPRTKKKLSVENNEMMPRASFHSHSLKSHFYPTIIAVCLLCK